MTKINVLGNIIDTKDLPKSVQRQIRRKRVRSATTPYIKMATVALVVDLALRAVL